MNERMSFTHSERATADPSVFFFRSLPRHAGYVIDFARVDADDLMIATIQAAGGVDDFLRILFQNIIS